MNKIKGLAFVAAAAFAVTSLYAGDQSSCCAQSMGGKMDKGTMSYSHLNLTAEQKTKMDNLQSQCHKGGCTKESMDNFMKSAEGILTKEQFATLKSECEKGHGEKTQG
jgi:Spy/CpxP family protein refolding chaperone